MVKTKVNVKTKNDSIPSDTTKRKMPIVVDPKLHPHPRYHDTNVGDIRFRIKTTKKDTVKADTIKINTYGHYLHYLESYLLCLLNMLFMYYVYCF